MEDKELIAAIHAMQLELTTTLATHTAKIDQHCDKLDIIFEKIERTDRTLYGVGGTEDGMATRVKILEESEETHTYTLRTLFAAIVGISVKVIYDIFNP